MNLKIVLTGGTGLIGSKLGLRLSNEGNEITLFTRNVKLAEKNQSWVSHIKKWDYNNPEQWKNSIGGIDAIVNLVGANLSAKRWSENYKKIIYNSRVISTRNMVNAISTCKVKPKAFITVSAVGIYGDKGDEILSENSNYGDDFLANLCKDWENEAAKVDSLGVRRVTLRIGIVLSTNGGMLKKLLLPYKLFLGGKLGNGNQWLPWIHIQDVINIIEFALTNDSLTGVVNCCAAGIVKMKDFAKTFGNIVHRPSYLCIPKFIIRIVLGEIANTAVSSQRISIEKLLAAGYKFKFPELENALKNLLKEV